MHLSASSAVIWAAVPIPKPLLDQFVVRFPYWFMHLLCQWYDSTFTLRGGPSRHAFVPLKTNKAYSAGSSQFISVHTLPEYTFYFAGRQLVGYLSRPIQHVGSALTERNLTLAWLKTSRVGSSWICLRLGLLTDSSAPFRRSGSFRLKRGLIQ